MKSAILLLFFGLFYMTNGIGQSNGIQFSKEWTEYSTVDGIKIEYKFQECNSNKVRNQVLVLFKFTNTTNTNKSISWVTKKWRDGNCSNCHRIDNPEYAHSLTIDANSSVEGDCQSKTNKALYIFSNFVKLSPGMSDSKLTNFELIDIQTQTLK